MTEQPVRKMMTGLSARPWDMSRQNPGPARHTPLPSYFYLIFLKTPALWIITTLASLCMKKQQLTTEHRRSADDVVSLHEGTNF